MDDLTDKKIENSTSAPAVVPVRSETENSAALITASDAEPEDVTGLQQLFGAELKCALAGISSTAPLTQTRTPTTAQRQRRPNPVIELAEVPAEVVADAPAPPRPNVLELLDPELWPDPVIGSDVLSAIAETFSRYVVLPDGAFIKVGNLLRIIKQFKLYRATNTTFGAYWDNLFNGDAHTFPFDDVAVPYQFVELLVQPSARNIGEISVESISF